MSIQPILDHSSTKFNVKRRVVTDCATHSGTGPAFLARTLTSYETETRDFREIGTGLQVANRMAT
jgi:hypothetical protein